MTMAEDCDRRCRMLQGVSDIWDSYAVGTAAAGGAAAAAPVGVADAAVSVDAGGTAAAIDAGGAAAGSVDAGGAATSVDAGGTAVSVGTGAAVSVGTGAAVSVGTGAAVSEGEGAVVSVGAGAAVFVGAGAVVSVGTGAVVSVGAGAADVAGGAAPPVAAAAATKMLKLKAVGVGLNVYPSGLSSMTVALSRVSVPCMNPFGVSVMLNLFTPGCTSNDCDAVSPVASVRLPGAVASTTAQSWSCVYNASVSADFVHHRHHQNLTSDTHQLEVKRRPEAVCRLRVLGMGAGPHHELVRRDGGLCAGLVPCREVVGDFQETWDISAFTATEWGRAPLPWWSNPVVQASEPAGRLPSIGPR